MKKLLVKYSLISTLLAAIALCLLGLPFNKANADPPEPTPSPALDIRTRLQPYQTPGVEPSQSDGRVLEGAPLPSEVEEPPVGALDQRTFYAIADATVLQGYPTLNFGDTVDMWAGYDEYLEPDGKIARSLVEFNIASLPTNVHITEARLKVYLVSCWDYPGTSRRIRTYRITSTWSENNVTWNNKPGYGSAYGSKSIVCDENHFGWYEFDVTNLVRAWHDGTYTNHGIMLRGPEVSGYNASWRGFSTREGPYRPRLVIKYEINTPPTITGLPDQSLEANTSLDNAIDLWAYASDAESPDSDLTFTIDNTPDPNAGVSVDSNRYIDINPTTGWTGQTDVVIRVTDPGGLSDTDTFRVTVFVTNSAPVIAGLPDQTLEANTSLDNTIDLWAYASDAESPDSDLTFTIDNMPDPNAGVSVDSNRYIDINPATDWTGQTDVVIRVTDPGGLSDTDTFSVEISSQEMETIYLPIILKNAGPPPAPVLNSIDNNDGNGSYTVSWSSVSGATEYVLQEDDKASFTSPTTVYSGANTSTTITGRDVGTYYYRVKATNSLGSSPWSNVVSTTVTQTAVVPKPGYWSGGSVSFEVSSDSSTVDWFELDVYVSGCGWYTLTWYDMAITEGQFSKGEFTTPTSASGSCSYFFEACNGWVFGWTSWSATWQHY